LGQSGIQEDTLFAANFGLAFPVSLVEDLYLVLEGNQCVRLSNPGELILESIWEPLIELPVECLVLDADSGFVDWVTWAKKTMEFVNEHQD